MSNDIPNFLKMKLNDLQSEATREVLKMCFFLNSGGIAATLTAFGNAVFQTYKCFLFTCLIFFVSGLVSAIFMALELRKFAYDIFCEAQKPSSTMELLRDALQNHRGPNNIKCLYIFSLVFFSFGIVAGIIMLFNSFCVL